MSAAGFIIYKKNKNNIKFLLLKTDKETNRCYDIPKGRKEPEELNLKCAIREVSEETNLRNPDRNASINFEDLKLLCTYRDKVEILKKNKVNKNKIAKDLLNIRQLFTKSIAPKYDLKKGTLLTKKNLTFKKPGNGIEVHKLKKVLGKKTRNNVSKHFLLKWSDIEK